MITPGKTVILGKWKVLLICFLLLVLVYMISQLLFFRNTKEQEGQICNIHQTGSIRRFPGSADIFYVCFTTLKGEEIYFNAGSNIGYKPGETVTVIYKQKNPSTARIKRFDTVWIKPAIPFLLLLVFLAGILIGIFYRKRALVVQTNPLQCRIQ